MDPIVQGDRRRGTDGIPSESGKLVEKFRLAESKRVDHVFRIGSTGQIRAHWVPRKAPCCRNRAWFWKCQGIKKVLLAESECIIEGWTNGVFGRIWEYRCSRSDRTGRFITRWSCAKAYKWLIRWMSVMVFETDLWPIRIVSVHVF